MLNLVNLKMFTLRTLLEEQSLLSEQSGLFLKIVKRAGSVKQAGKEFFFKIGKQADLIKRAGPIKQTPARTTARTTAKTPVRTPLNFLHKSLMYSSVLFKHLASILQKVLK